MKNKSEISTPISRRGLLPILASGLLVPFLGLGNSNNETIKGREEEEEYQTLLKPDGTVVKVKKKTVQESKIIQKDMSNKSLSNWLDKNKP
jgi:hypothetical protein